MSSTIIKPCEEETLIETSVHYIYKGKHKKFDQLLYDKYDIPARELIKKKLGEYVMDNPDIYGEDMILNDKKCKYKYIELQVCATWDSEYGKYPHKYPFVYERKGNFDDTTLYIIFDKHFEKGLLFGKHALAKEPSRIKPYSRTLIYQANWNSTIEFFTDNLDIDLIRIY